MKWTVRKALCFILALAMAVPALSGCSSSPNGTGSGGNASAGGAADNAPAELHIFNRVNAQVSFDNNDWLKAVEKAANVKLEIEAPPINNYDDKLQVLMASGDLPDIIYNWHQGNANYQKWAEDGLLADITDKVKNYPSLMDNITEDMWNSVRVKDGKIYSVPKPNMEAHWAMIMNQKWLDKLGLKAPTTLDEFEKVAVAFSTQDPDGNGKADTYGVSFTSNSNSCMQGPDFLKSAFNISNYDGAKDVDGNYKIPEKFKGYIPYMTYLRKLYAEKAIDPEFFTNKVYADTDKLAQNKVGIVSSHENGVLTGVSTLPDYDKTFHYYASPKNESGVSTIYIALPVWGQWMISKNSSNVDAALKFLDWGNSKEGFTMMNIGVKGVDYNSFDMETHKIDRTDAQAQKLDTECSSYTSIAYAYKGKIAILPNGNTDARLKVFNDQYNEMIKSVKEVRLPSITSVTCPQLTNFSTTNPDILKECGTYSVKYIVGEITLEQFQDFLNNKYFPKIADAEKEYVAYMNSLK
jgi:putative aldouronate transport system substrate-binding protein